MTAKRLYPLALLIPYVKRTFKAECRRQDQDSRVGNDGGIGGRSNIYPYQGDDSTRTTNLLATPKREEENS